MLPFPEIEKIAEPPRQVVEQAAPWWHVAAQSMLGLLVLGLVLGIVIFLVRRAGMPGLPVRPDKLALRDLQALRRRTGTMEAAAFGAALLEIVRTFLHRRLGLPARFSTTSELLGRSRRPDEPPPAPVLAAFAPVLDGCDALRFSTGTQAARESLLDAAEAAVQSVAAAPPPRILTELPAVISPPPEMPHATPA